MTQNRKIILIGFDGATFDVIDPLVKRGELPTFKKLIQQGVSAELQSTIPPITSSAWTSMFTGVNPGKHGVYSWRDKEGNVVSSKNIRAETLWKLLTRHGRKGIYINIPVSYPVPEINGIILSGILTPPNAKFTNVDYILSDLEKCGYQFYYPTDAETSMLYLRDRNRLVDKYLNAEESRACLATQLIQKYDWDIFTVIFTQPDPIQHFFWSNPKSGDFEITKPIMDCYLKLDELLNQIFVCVEDEEPITFIVSDHGFGPLWNVFNINFWLEQNGYLNVKKSYLNNIARFFKRKLGFRTSNIFKFVSKNRPFINVVSKLPNSVREKSRRHLSQQIKLPQDLDYSTTKAYGMSSIFGFIYFLSSDDNCRKNLTMDLKRKLLSLKEPGNSKPVIRMIHEKNQVYHGSNLNDAPDLIVEMNEGYEVSESIYEEEIFTKADMVGTHKMKGIFIAHGKDVFSGKRLDAINIWDVMPTLLFAMDIPTPSNTDGRVIQEIFKENSSLAKQEIQYELPMLKNEKEFVWTKDDEDKIKERLKALGYI